MNTTTVQNGACSVNWDGSVTFHTVVCGECAGVYAITERHRQYCYDNAKSWHCPYCEVGWGYRSGNSALDREKQRANRAEEALSRESAYAQRMRDERDTAERQRRGQKAAKTRVMNRIKAGECPCCGKSFPDLHRHMRDAHPSYAE